MSTVISIIWFLVIFCIVVVSHEFGHFLIAKANGIHVVEFYVGFGPTLIHWTRKGTKYSIKLLPLGGACIFEGMDAAALEKEEEDRKKPGISQVANVDATEIGDEEESDSAVMEAVGEADSIDPDTEEDEVSEAAVSEASEETETASKKPDKDKKSYGGSFLEASVWARFSTILAGPLFNMILGFIISFILVNMIIIREPVATEILEGGAAQEAGLEPGDRILTLNGQKICLYEDIVLFNAFFNGGEVFVEYERDGKQYGTVLVPKYNEEEGRYLLGISNQTFVELKGLQSLKYTWYEMRYNLKMTYGSLGMLFKGRVTSKDISGPVGIAVNVVGATYESTKQYGFQTVLVNMLNIALMLTVNLGILNLLPIPALDGGRLLFTIIEMLRGKPIPPEKEAIVHFIGVVFFLILVVFVFFNDIRNIFIH